MGNRSRRALVGTELGYRHLVLATAALVSLTALLGVATRATGAGLACQANWPLCDGGILNMFPATFPSSIEWIHRVVAMVTGLFVLATAWSVYRGRADRLGGRAVAIGLALLPVQILLGRETVRSFTPPVLGAHYWVAMAIYGAFVGAAVSAWRDALGPRHVRIGLGAAVLLVPAQVLLSPSVVTRYSAPVQTAQYAVILALFAALVLATVAARDGLVRRGLALTTALVPVVVFLGRQRIVHGQPTLAAAHGGATLLLLASVLALAIGVFVVPRSGSDRHS